MAHFAQLDKNQTVISVIAVSDDVIENVQGLENEVMGVEFCQSLFGLDTIWAQCSYSGSFRKQYPGSGCVFLPNDDVFIGAQPYPSWSLDKNFDWQPPIPYPDDGQVYVWDELTYSWVLASVVTEARAASLAKAAAAKGNQ